MRPARKDLNTAIDENRLIVGYTLALW